MSHLKQQVVEILAKQSSKKAAEFTRRFQHPQRSNVNEALLIHDLNTFWRLELCALMQNTIPAREALYDNVSGLEWLELFERYVAPTVLQYWGGSE